MLSCLELFDLRRQVGMAGSARDQVISAIETLIGRSLTTEEREVLTPPACVGWTAHDRSLEKGDEERAAQEEQWRREADNRTRLDVEDGYWFTQQEPNRPRGG